MCFKIINGGGNYLFFFPSPSIAVILFWSLALFLADAQILNWDWIY